MARPSVLIVDDHAGFRSMARALLARAGFDVVGEAANGAAAIRAIASLRPAVVLLDVQLPDLDGFELAGRLARPPVGPRVVFVSTRDAGDYRQRLAASGAAGYITKARLSGDTLRAALGAGAEGIEP